MSVASHSISQVIPSLNREISWDISGTGTITDTSSDSASFVWNLSLEQPTTGGPTEFTFSAGTQAAGGGGTEEVPDGGLTLAMLGIAFAGIEIFRRKLSKA